MAQSFELADEPRNRSRTRPAELASSGEGVGGAPRSRHKIHSTRERGSVVNDNKHQNHIYHSTNYNADQSQVYANRQTQNITENTFII